MPINFAGLTEVGLVIVLNDIITVIMVEKSPRV